jgi:hypothetical protein
MPLNRPLVEFEEFLAGVAVRLDGDEWDRFRSIPSAQLVGTARDDQLGSGRQFVSTPEKSIGGRRVSIAEEEIEGDRIDVDGFLGSLKNGPHLGPEIEPIACDAVVDQLDSEWIASEQQSFFVDIPDRQPEHSVKPVENLIAPLLVSMNDDFGIGLRAEDVSVGLEYCPQLLEVVDLAVEYDPYGFCLIRHGLVSAAKIDDREPPEAEAQRTGKIEPFIVRPAMGQRSRHPLDIIQKDRALIDEVVLTADTAHGIVTYPLGCSGLLR